MKKLYIYTGCHGIVFENFINADYEFNVKFLQNWQAIRDDTPPDINEILDSDIFLYTPVYNKPKFNTQPILDSLAGSGVKLISLPWLQWNGLFPFYKQHGGLDSGSKYQWWFCERIKEAANGSSSFSQLKNSVLEHDFISSVEIEQQSLFSLNHLADLESCCDIKVSEIIANQMMVERTFLIPDHPANTVYRPILAKVGYILNLMSMNGNKFMQQDNQYHDDSILPILPCVYKHFSLDPKLDKYYGVFKNRWLFEKELEFDDFILLHYDFDLFKNKHMKNI